MTKKGERGPKPEELALWRETMKRARPLAKRPAGLGARPEPLQPSAARAPAPAPGALPRPAPVTVSTERVKPVPALPAKLVRALSRGSEAIDARIDLHGMTQERARATIERFLSYARARGYRLVLVVTGKGAAGAARSDAIDPYTEQSPRGVLRAMLPRWLSLPPMCDWILGMSPASPRHGGDGALYIQLRKARAR
jgi:DNA-nicking Smr family endonuclease